MKRRSTKMALMGSSVVLSLTFAFGPPAFGQSRTVTFDAVRVSGNERMAQDEVLSLCGLEARRSFSETDLQAAVNCLGESGRFRAVTVQTEGRDLVVQVDEAPNYTGFFDISASVDTERGASAKLEVQDRDLFDRGIEGGFVLDVAREEQTASASLANPNFLGRDWRAGISLGYSDVDYDDQSFSYKRATLAAFLGVPLSDQQVLTFRAGLQADELYDVSALTSPILQREAGKRSAPFLAIDYEAVFLREGPAEARFEFQASQVFSGIGEDYSLSSTRLRAKASAVAIPDRLSVSLSIEGGHLQANGAVGPTVLNRFQLGGATLRGFAPRGIGPTDGGDRLGGTDYAVASIETRSPLFSLGSTQIEGGVFAEAGSVWGLTDRAGFVSPVDDAAEIRSSAGVSVTANIGNIPVTMYYAKPVQSLATDKLQSFGLSLTSKF